MRYHARIPTARTHVGVAAAMVVAVMLGACSSGPTASPTPSPPSSSAPSDAPGTLTKCSDISDVMTLLADVGKQLARDKEAGAASGVQEADYERLKKQSATRMDELAGQSSDPKELQQVAILFSTVFGFGLENPASEGPFNSAGQLFEKACGYPLFR